MIVTRDFVRTLGTVVDVAVDVINRPAIVSRIPAITDLAAVVDADRAVMVEGGPVVRGEASVLLDVLAHIEAERMQGGPTISRADRWCMVAGCLLPMVRENLADALQRRPRAATSDHDFGRAQR
jgi:hypothetical protein